jgi:hypothetical protein
VLVDGGVADDHRLAPTEVEPGGRRLVRHAPGEAEDVLQRVLLGGVGVEAGAAEGRAQPGGVDGDDRPEPARPVVAEHDLLVAVRFEALEDLHSRPRLQAELVDTSHLTGR